MGKFHLVFVSHKYSGRPSQNAAFKACKQPLEALILIMKAGLSFVSNASIYSGPTGLLDNQLMRMEAESGYTCDITLSGLICEAILQVEGKCEESAERVGRKNQLAKYARGNPSSLILNTSNADGRDLASRGVCLMARKPCEISRAMGAGG